MSDQFTTIDRLKLKKAKENWLDKWRRVRAERQKIRGLWMEIYSIARDIKQRYGIDLKAGRVREFARQLHRYRCIDRFSVEAHGGSPTCPADMYAYCKDLIKWNHADLQDFKKEYSRHYWKDLTPRDCEAKLIVDLAHEYILLYEWAMSIPNGYCPNPHR